MNGRINSGRTAVGSIRKQKIVAVLVVVVGVFSGFSTASASLLDAFIMAVEHFDPNHELGLELDSAEVQFMQQALGMARDAIPEVVGIHVPTDRSGRNKFGPVMFHTLKLVDTEELPDRRTLTPELKAEIAEKVGEECRVEINTYESIASKSNPRLQRSTLWTFDHDCREEELEKCRNQDIARWLCSRGVLGVLLIENSYKGRNRAELYLRFNQVVDLEFKSKQLMADPDYQATFGEYALQPYPGRMYGDGKSVEVVAEPGLSGFDGVVLKFNFGWGDCPSGCMYWHHWIFKYRTMGEKENEGWPLVGGLVEEGGRPIDEYMRGQLRSAVPIR